MEKYKIGDLVWAKMKGFSPWPGRVSNPIEDMKKLSSKDMHCIFFFGSNNYAWIKESNIKPYFTFKEKFVNANKSKAFKEAVEAIEDYIWNYRGISMEAVNSIKQEETRITSALVSNPNINLCEKEFSVKITPVTTRENKISPEPVKSVKKEETCLTTTLEPNPDINLCKKELSIKLVPVTTKEEKNEQKDCVKFNQTLYSNEEKCDFPTSVDVKQEVTYQFTKDIISKIDNDKSAISVNENGMTSIGKYEEEECSILVKDIKIETVHEEYVSYGYSEHEDTEDSTNVKEDNMDHSFIDRIPKLISCSKNDKKNNSYSEKLVIKEIKVVEEEEDLLSPHNIGKRINDRHPHEKFKERLESEYDLQQENFTSENNLCKDKKKYSCAICVKVFNKTGSLSKHILTHNKDRICCHICNKTFTDNRHLKLHMNVHNEDRAIYSCNICKKKLVRQKLFLSHMKKHKVFEAQTCNICKRSYDDKKKLTVHLLGHHGDGNYICYICDSSYVNKILLEKHLLHGNCVTKHNCKFCDRIFVEKRRLNDHLKSHSSRKYFCDICKACFRFKGHLLKHLQVHSNIRFSCTQCKSKFTREINLKRHIMTVHALGRNFICHVCHKTFKSKYDLSAHIKQTHSMDKPFCCDICFKSFASKKILRRHLVIHIDNKMYYSCDVCNKSFTQRIYLIKHIRRHDNFTGYFDETCKKSFRSNLSGGFEVHSKEKNYICSTCNKSFVNKDSLRVHIHSHEKRRYFCDICNKSFRSNLPRHLATHSKEKNYTCSICNKRFITKCRLYSHMRSHEKPRYFCTICNKGIRGNRSDLSRHMVLHTGEKNYSCSICKKSFALKLYLQNHMKHKHV